MSGTSMWGWIMSVAVGGVVCVLISFRCASCAESAARAEAERSAEAAVAARQCREEMITDLGVCPHPGQTIEATYHAERFICRCPKEQPAAASSSAVPR